MFVAKEYRSCQSFSSSLSVSCLAPTADEFIILMECIEIIKVNVKDISINKANKKEIIRLLMKKGKV